MKPEKRLKPLLKPLNEITPPKMNYLGTAFGLTPQLFGFWSRNGYRPLYLRQRANDVTGEFSVILLQELKNNQLSEELAVSKKNSY